MNDQLVNIIYGTVTGNAQDLAERLSDACDKRGLPISLTAAEDWPLARFSEVKRVILIFSTWGTVSRRTTRRIFVRRFIREMSRWPT